MLSEAELANFTGSAEWHRHWTRSLTYTDGVKHVAEAAGAYWLIDAIASYQPHVRKNRRLDEFQVWEVEVSGPTAVLTCRADSGKPPAVHQPIAHTDFPFTIKLYVENRVLMLPSER